MAFGLLKHFKDARKANQEVTITRHAKHVIVGHDLGAVLKLIEVRKNFPDDSVKIVTNRPLSRQILIENYQFGVSTLRSSEAVEGIYRKHFGARILPDSKEPSFYKDGKFHEFGSRAKPMELLAGEEFFAKKGHRLDVSSFFDETSWNDLDTIINDALDVRIFESIEKSTPNDLVEKQEWTLTFKDFTKLTCENLYVSLSPKKFLSYLSNKESLTAELIDVCSAATTRGAISVTLMLNKEFSYEGQTLFVPQSMTHEWGHFIVEFEHFDHRADQGLCHVLFLVHEEEPQSEDLAAKIKLMKRVLDRVFPDIEKHITKEYIRFDEEMFISDIKDQTAEQLGFDYPTLKFLGQAAPMSSAHAQEKFIARTLLQ
jgi:hypothetical protein